MKQQSKSGRKAAISTPSGGPVFVSPEDQKRMSLDSPNDAAITRLVGALLLEQDEHWELEGRRMFSAESMAATPALEELPTQPSLQDRPPEPTVNTQAPGEPAQQRSPQGSAAAFTARVPAADGAAEIQA